VSGLPPEKTFRDAGLAALTTLVGLAFVGFFLYQAVARERPLGDRLALVVFAAVFASFFYGAGRPRVRVDAAGLEVRNYLRSHAVAWGDIDRFELPSGAPWARVLLTDGGTVALHAIQPPGISWILNRRSGAHEATDELNGLLSEFRVGAWRKA
jgi:hypothetical protein